MARIGLSTSRHLPTVRVQPRSEFLHAVRPMAAVTSLQEILARELRRLRFWAALYAELGISITYDPVQRRVRAEALPVTACVTGMCRRGDLNPHALAGTSPSSWRVCLFRHSDERPTEVSARRS